MIPPSGSEHCKEPQETSERLVWLGACGISSVHLRTASLIGSFIEVGPSFSWFRELRLKVRRGRSCWVGMCKKFHSEKWLPEGAPELEGICLYCFLVM